MKTKVVPFNPFRILIVAPFILAAIFLAACGGKDPIAVPSGAQAGDLTMEPCTYEQDDVEHAADCGTLVVPENRNDPDSRLIALPVISVRATGDSPAEPIFWLTGGPGSSNMHFSHFEGLLDNHDIVMVGYRGVDGSVVLDCPEVTRRGVGKVGIYSAMSRSPTSAKPLPAARLACGIRVSTWMALPYPK